MLWDVVHSRRLVKHGKLPMRYLRVATTLKATSHEFLRHFMSLLRHAYKYLQIPKTFSVELVGHYNSWQLSLQAASYDLR